MLPDGVPLGRLQGALQNLMGLTQNFTGAMHITGPGGAGVLLIDSGHPIAARFEEDGKSDALRGEEAYERFLGEPDLECDLVAYTPAELRTARNLYRDAGCLIGDAEPAGGVPDVVQLSERRLELIGKQPGVIAVSVFHEGFALQSLGDADFEQVAAVAEDLLRAGMKITTDMAMGNLNQTILETLEGKLIIAPYGDLYICVLARPDAHIGLIRLAIRSMQGDRA